MTLDRTFIVWALSYAAIGLTLGIYMAASQNHEQLVTHTHILLIGFVLSFVYGIIHKLWLDGPNRAVANIQCVLHQAAAITISIGLFLLYGHFVPGPKLDPILGTAATGVLVGMLLMLYMLIRYGTAKTVARNP